MVFDSYGDFSLNVLVYFFLKTPDWSEELVQKQNVFLEIYRLAQKLGVQFAFPTQTLHMESFPEKKPTREPGAFSNDDLLATANGFGPQGGDARPAGAGIFTPPHTEARG